MAMAADGFDEVDGGFQTAFVISVAAQLAGMHPQTLRQYDRLGLVTPARAKGRGRRYTRRDIQRLRDVHRMSHEEGINLAGIQRILDLERRVEHLEQERARIRARLEELEMRGDRVFAASSTGEVLPLRRGQRVWPPSSATAVADMAGGGALVPWDPWMAYARAVVARDIAHLRRLEAAAPVGRGSRRIGDRRVEDVVDVEDVEDVTVPGGGGGATVTP